MKKALIFGGVVSFIIPQHYALGWRNSVDELYEEKRQVRILHHGGTALGATALLILFPEYQLSIYGDKQTFRIFYTA